jgi:phosphohistidine swiveling domain-containing protein
MKVREKDDLAAENERFVRSWVSNQGRDWELVKFCTLEEFPAIPSDKVLEERRSKGFIAIDGREYFLGTIEEYAAAHPEFDFVKPQAEQAAEYVTGAIGYKGRVQGIVRLVKNTQMMDRVKDGDILVSPMTTPDFLLAMKKAAAFVTDEGGIMCHAAIVAREMKKPCVIGTKIATQVLKDGDLVEVDANAGVVRVIQKA